MNTVIYYRDSNGNPGDTCSNMGCQLLLSKAIGPHYTVSYYANQPFSLDMPLSVNDVAVVCGSPWLWNHCETSAKYALLRNFLKLADAKVKVVVGLGSSYTLDTTPDPLTCDVWRDFDLVLCRDRLAAQLLANQGVASLTVPCPAFFAGRQLARHRPAESKLLVYTAFASSVPGSNFADQGRITEYDNWQLDWLKRGFPTLAMTVPDYEDLVRRGFEPRYYSTDPRSFAAIMALHHEVYSGRVHGAIVAKAIGCDSYLFPIDSRSVTAAHLGVNMFMAPGNYAELDNVLKLRLTHETVARFIQTAVAKKLKLSS